MPPLLKDKGLPVGMLDKIGARQIIEPRAFESTVAQCEAGGVDQVHATPRQAPSRKMVPVFYGMSGSKSAHSIIRLGDH